MYRFRWQNAIHPEDRESIIKFDQALEDQAKLICLNIVFFRRSTSWVIDQAIPEKNTANEIVGYIGTMTDITEKKLAKKRLENQQKNGGGH
jgi:PAS domain-containing protein